MMRRGPTGEAHPRPPHFDERHARSWSAERHGRLIAVPRWPADAGEDGEIGEARAATDARDRGWLMRRLLLLADVLAFLAAFGATYALSETGAQPGWWPLAAFAATLPLWFVLAKVYGLYERDEERTDHTTADDLGAIFHMVTIGTWAAFVVVRLTGLHVIDISGAVTFWALAIAAMVGARAAARTLARRQRVYLQNAVVVGAGDVGQSVARKLLRRPDLGVNLVGFVDRAPRQLSADLSHVTLLGTPEDLPAIVRTLDVDRVVIAFSQDAHEDTLELVRMLSDLSVQVDIVPRLFEIFGPSVDIHTVEGLPLIGLPPLRLSSASLFLKRVIDIGGAAAGLLFMAPALALLALAIRLDSPGPVLYRSPRVGRNNSRFALLKFRTMAIEHCRGAGYGGDSADAEFQRLMTDPRAAAEFARTHKLADDPRVTRVGRWLRRTSLDELPQLLNVIKGDISLVGPRPITTYEYEDIERREGPSPFAHGLAGYWDVQDLRPGITGYWQISGRSEVGYAERVRLDLAYVKGWSLKLDSMILAKTLRALVSSRGAY